MAQDEGPEQCYLFDDDALEKSLSAGTPHHHQCVEECGKLRLRVTKESKDIFAATLPDDLPRLDASFELFRGNAADNATAGRFSDVLQNQFDVDDYDIQMKIFFLAKASRGGFTVVTGEEFTLSTTMQQLANALDIPCISLDAFLLAEG